MILSCKQLSLREELQVLILHVHSILELYQAQLYLLLVDAFDLLAKANLTIVVGNTAVKLDLLEASQQLYTQRLEAENNQLRNF
jgi:hypothetical protein